MMRITERAYFDCDAGDVRVMREHDSNNDSLTIKTGGAELSLYYNEIQPVIDMLQSFKREIDAEKPAPDGGL